DNCIFFFSSRRRHTRFSRDWSSDVCSSDLNPKTAVFFAAVLPQFVDRSAGHASVQMIIFGMVFALIAFTSDAVYGASAGAVREWFARSTRRLDLVGGAAGLTLVGLGVTLAVSGRKD